jgi:formate C-acetyltransferase
MVMKNSRIESLKYQALNNGTEDEKLPENRLLWFRGWLAARDEEEYLVRRAKARAYEMANSTPVIRDGELISGIPCRRIFTPEEKEELRFYEAHIAGSLPVTGGQHSHMAVDYPLLLERGITGIIGKINELKQNLDLTDPEELEKDEFYRAAGIVLEGLLEYADRYAEAAEVRARMVSDPDRRRELLETAESFRRVPRFPASSFREALQSVHFLTFNLQGLYQLGRPDRYLIGYYRNDIEKGIIDREQAQELIDCLCILFNNYIPRGLAAGFMIGGSDSKGNDTANELTELFLESIGHTGMIYPGIGLCVTPETDEKLLLKSTELLSGGFTHPALFNDRVIVQGLKNYGLPPEEACEYIHSTCVEITPAASSGVWVASPYINLLDPFLEILQQVEDAPGTFDELLTRYRRGLAQTIAGAAAEQNRLQKERALHGGDPLVSCFVNDCISRGKDIDRGGARYNWIMPSFVGLANLADSIGAVKKLVFEDGTLPLEELVQILKTNFQDTEEFRRELIRKLPKYGNDIPEADDLIRVILDFIKEEAGRYRTWRGDRFIPSLFCWVMHERLGRDTPATPDGRKSGYPLGDGSGPAQGRDTRGPTASILSATSWDHSPFIGGIAVNMKFSKQYFTEEGGRKMISLIRTFMERGGFELQINAVDRETLIAARKEPEKYRNLVVRIGGYSDYFTSLSFEMQQEVLERTEHQL